MVLGDTTLGTRFSQITDHIVGNPLIYPRRIFMALLRRMFAQETVPNINDGRGTNPYTVTLRPDNSQDYDTSNLIISDAYDLDSADIPQIIVNRSTAQWQDLSAGDRSGGGPKVTVNHNGDFSDIVTIPIEISAVSENQIEAENLAWLSSFFIKIHEIEIRKRSALLHIGSFAMGPAEPEEVSSEIERFRVRCLGTVQIGFSWRKTATITIEDVLENPCLLRDEEGCPVPPTTFCVTANTDPKLS